MVRAEPYSPPFDGKFHFPDNSITLAARVDMQSPGIASFTLPAGQAAEAGGGPCLISVRSEAQKTTARGACPLLVRDPAGLVCRFCYCSFGRLGKRITLPARIRSGLEMAGLCCLTRSTSESSSTELGLVRYTSLTKPARVSPGFTTLVL